MSNTVQKSQDIHDVIHERRSMGVLNEPAPNAEQLNKAFHAAWVAPDHRRLKPTRFVVISAEQRTAFAECLVESYIHEHGADDQVQIERIRQQPLRAPMIILALTKIQAHDKVPSYEQLLSSGAAVQNLLLSLHAQGFASMWRSGELAESAHLKATFALEAQDYIAGVIYVGSTDRVLPARDDAMSADFIQYWTP
ncbi:MAG: nitroreductase [Acinetobacter sp.]|nr:nitroreductase [Acinetobacter sp.]